MDSVAEKAGVQGPQQWRTVGTAMVKQLGGAGLLDRYGGSVARLLEACYPEVEWKPWHLRKRFGKAHWTLPENRRAFLHQLAAEFSIERPEDWKRVSSEDIRARGGAPLLSRKGPTLCSHLSEAFPGQEFDEVLCRPRISQQHWECPGARRRFMEALAGELGLEGPGGWAAVSRDVISSRGGSGLLALYGNSVFRLLEDIFPEVMGGAGSERKLPQGFWDSEVTRLRFMADIAERYGVKTAGDWRRVTTAMVVQEGGSGLIQRYPSLAAAIGELWKPQHGSDEVMDVFDCRKVVPAEFWKEEANVRKVIHRVAADLHLASPGDWARVSHAQLRDQNAFGLLRHMTLLDALRIAYPDMKWSERDLERAGGRRAVQRHLAVQVQRLLPTTVLEDHQHVLKRHSSRAVELDIFLPEHNLALEYNGEHHYAVRIPLLCSEPTHAACLTSPEGNSLLRASGSDPTP